MNAVLRKMAVLCLVLVLAGAAWAGNCKGKSADNGNGDDKKACESKEKQGNGEKAGCEKAEDKACEKAA